MKFLNFITICLLINFVNGQYDNDFDDDDIPMFDYQITNTLELYNNSLCYFENTRESYKNIFNCKCSEKNNCLDNYFKSDLFKLLKYKNIFIDKLCHIDFKNKSYFNKCIKCNLEKSLQYNIEIKSNCDIGDSTVAIVFLVFSFGFICCGAITFMVLNCRDKNSSYTRI